MAVAARTRSKRSTRENRRTAILEAAAQVFFEQGYAATSIDAIIERIGGSKRTIYNEFGSKEGIFTALVTENADAAVAALSVERFAARNLSEVLLEFGRRLLAIYMSPAVIGIYRSIMTEAPRFPKLAKAFYDKGPGRASDRLADVLEDAKARGEIQIGDCHLAADHFVGMLRDNLHLRVILGLRPPPSAAEAEAAVASTVNIFLYGIHGAKLPQRSKRGAQSGAMS
ncbi:TetR/AcrR family transcriptional regulator [Bradyrhizobium liaoningense]|uniref:TetR/AcrR family transcriptional regulator n=1 Tax=Bradyrhizobium liaoningense TaxID=43992 RepID=UPI001BA6A22D|nr:TetR/AcrR family transcriptional regulator [Bradyrhizobium liaoningense]MBR0823468.1 TetR/AcrR family transcriptional regulator [Bradyrhizobium liaoningense]